MAMDGTRNGAVSGFRDRLAVLAWFAAPWRRKAGFFGLFALAAVLAPVSAAVAAEAVVSTCSGFCTPIEPAQLDRYRAQGLDAPGAEMKLGVILWDEYRRTRQPPDTGDAATGGISLAHISIGPGTNSR
jgi:hypothetical protein